MKTTGTTLLALTFVLTQLMAQDEVDVLRYSSLAGGGTARSMAMAGSFGALGADFSNLSNNPAGIALYKQSEFTFTPALYTINTSSLFMGETHDDYKYNLNINNIGFVWTIEPDEGAQKQGWRSMQFGFGMNRTNNFHNRVLIEGVNQNSSIMDDYLDKAWGLYPEELSDFDTGLAWDTWLLTTTDTNDPWIDKIYTTNYPVLQRKTITTTGNMKEWVVSFGGNYKDKLYLGGTVGIPTLRYREQAIHREFELEDEIPVFSELKIYDHLKVTGSGINLKLGMIYRINDFARIGMAVHTPSYFVLNDKFKRTISSVMDGEKTGEPSGNYESVSPENVFNYQINTPLRAQASAGFVIGKIGAINLDYEFVDYSDGRVLSGEFDFTDENDAARSKYRANHNIRTGVELNLKPMAIRAGYGIQGTPFHTSINDATRTTMSLGVGFKDEDYFFDIAYVYSQVTDDYYLYNPNSEFYTLDPATRTLSSGQIMFTLGFRY